MQATFAVEGWSREEIVRDLGVVHFSTSRLVIQVIHAISVHHAKENFQGRKRGSTYLRFLELLWEERVVGF